MKLCVLACAALATGCSTAHILMPRRSAPAGVEERAASLRAASWSAFVRGDTAGLHDVLGDGSMIVLPSGDTLRDPARIRAALASLVPSAAQLEPTFFREGVHWCTDAFVEYGTIGLYRDDGGRRPVHVGRVSMTWDVRDPVRVGLRSASLYPVHGDDAYRARPCATPMDSVFAKWRVSVVAHGVASVTSQWDSDVRGQLASAGWGVADPRRYAPHATEVGPAVAVRVRMPGPFTVGAFASGVKGMDHAEHPDHTVVALQYDGVLLGGMVGVQWGFLGAAAGPTYLRMDGRWRTMGGPPDGPPPSLTVARDWNAWSLGVVGETGAVVPLSSRFAIDGRYQYRWFPSAAVPGYRSSRAMDLEFTHSVLLLGIGVSF